CCKLKLQFFCNSSPYGWRYQHLNQVIQIATFAEFSYYPFIGSATTEEKDTFRFYSNETNKYIIMWLPTRRKYRKQLVTIKIRKGNGLQALTGFYAQVASESNVSVFITFLGADFTRIEYFGKVEEFAKTLVSGLDRSWKRPPGASAKLIFSSLHVCAGFDNIEHTLQKPGESCRHIFSKIDMFIEEEISKYSSNVQKMKFTKYIGFHFL
ncbi:hypothetical protein MKX03_029986, partial [Papaver bracteatum]